MKKGVLTIALLLSVSLVYAQLRIIPVEKQGSKKPAVMARTADTPLALPFYDDFSSASVLDTLHWINSENVLVNDGLSFVPPSLGVVSFDGLDHEGNPYGAGSSSGEVDSLVSQTIDLSSFSASDNIFMSFFYQAGGLGNLPNEDDSLQLEFFNAEGNWESVWPAESDVFRDREFHQVFVMIAADRFFHESFRFRFKSVGNVSGNFDIWNLDYIYINKNRYFGDGSYPDRAINEPLTSFINDYYAVPYQHYNSTYNREPQFWLRNLVTVSQNVNRAYQYLFNYTIGVTDSLGNTTEFSNSTEVTPLESPIQINTTEMVTIREPLPDFSGIDGADSAYIALEIILDAEDNKPLAEGGDYDVPKYSPVDFRHNDTLRVSYILDKYYAYDDGSSEAAAGLNFAGDRLAYQYELLSDSSDVISGVDLYFPFTGSEPSGRSIDLSVWADEDGRPGEVLYSEPVIIQRAQGLDTFIRYDLIREVTVSGTFYVGYRQNDNGSLGVGLDRNNLSTDRMFYNLDVLWEENSLVQGSLMIRPVFDEKDNVVVGSDDLIRDDVVIYPNPSASGVFTLSYPVSNWQISDLHGRVIQESNGNETRTISLQHAPPGIYILSGEFRGRMVVVKLVNGRL